MPSLAQVIIDLNTATSDIWDGVSTYTSVTPAQLNADSPSGLQNAAINLHNALENLLHDAGISTNKKSLVHKA